MISGRYLSKCAFLALLFCLDFTGCAEKEAVNKEVEIQSTAQRNVKYELTQVGKGTVEKAEYIKCNYRQTEEVQLYFEVDQEMITNVLVESGDVVKKGDVLATVNVEATDKKRKELAFELSLEELYLKQLTEERDFELEQADILFSYTCMTEDDKDNLVEEKQKIGESYEKKIRDYEDTISIMKKRLAEYEEYVANGKLLSPMDGMISYVRGNLVGSLTNVDESVIRVYDPKSQLFVCDKPEYAPYFEEDAEYTISCGIGRDAVEYIVIPVNMKSWGEEIYFKLLTEDYATGSISNGKIRLVLERKEGVLCLDADAVHTSGADYYVYVLDENNIRRMQFVEVGLWGNETVEIVNGLAEGDKVILN